MKFNNLPKNVREKIEYLFNGDKKPVFNLLNNYGNFKLIDKAPDLSYYSYYVSVEGRNFMISINFEENNIYMHNYNKVYFGKKF